MAVTGNNGIEVAASVNWNVLVSAVVEGAARIQPGRLAMDDADRLEIAARNIRERIAEDNARRGKRHLSP